MIEITLTGYGVTGVIALGAFALIGWVASCYAAYKTGKNGE